MNVRKLPEKSNDMPRRLLSITEASVYLGLGKSAARNYLDRIGARVNIGRRVLYDKEIIDMTLSSTNQKPKQEEDYGNNN